MVGNLGKTDLCGATASAIEKFESRFWLRLIECAGISERIAQLATTHPLVFFALATRYGPLKYRREAVRLAVDGHPLRDICAAIGLPLPLRRIPPEACARLLPHVRWSPTAGRNLAPLVPKTPETAALWLPRVHLAHRYGDEEFALWFAAQHTLLAKRSIGRAALTTLAIYAWNTRFAPLPLEASPIPPWTREMSLELAITRCASWFQQIQVVCDLTPEGLIDPWLPGGSVGSYIITPLLTPEQLLAEARHMQNCVASYSFSLAVNECRLYSVFSGSKHVATFELRYSRRRMVYKIAQVKGPSNSTAPYPVMRAVQTWLRRNSNAPPPPGNMPKPARDRTLLALLAPYLEIHGDTAPPADLTTFRTLSMGLGELTRMTKVESRFTLAAM